MTGTQILKLIKDWYEKVFINLRESEVEELLSDFECKNFELHKPYFVSTNGKIFTDKGSAVYLNHAGIFDKVFTKHLNIELPKDTDLWELLDDEQLETDMYKLYTKCIDRLLEKFNWIKLNTGSICDENEAYAILPTKLSYNQHSILSDFLFILNQDKVQIFVPTNGYDKTVTYYFDEYTPEEILDRIDTYYRTGTLLAEEKEKENYTDQLIEEYL